MTYVPAAGTWDEALAADGAPRAHYAEVMGVLGEADLAAMAESVRASLAADHVLLGAGADAHPYLIDVVPRVFAREEWELLAAGLGQQLRALEAFLADAYGPREAVRAGVVAADLIDGSLYFERDLAGLPAPPVRIGMAGPDVVRGADGRLLVLEDNVRTPSLQVYVLAARRAVLESLPWPTPPVPVTPEAVGALLRRALRGAAPELDDPVAAVLTDVERSAGPWELHRIAPLIGAPRVELEDLRHAGDRLVMRAGGRPIDVLYRRTSDERLRDGAGRLTALGEALLGPLRAGTLRVVNAFGAGVADDKLTYAHVEDLVRFHLGEEPLLPSARTLDLSRAAGRAEALERLDELVLKPRTGSGGYGVLVGPRATRTQLERARELLRAAPADWIAQDALTISTHPTLIDGRLEPRHLDLRPFVSWDGRETQVLPGGISRFARAAGDLIVNSSQGGGGKDTWVLDDA